MTMALDHDPLSIRIVAVIVIRLLFFGRVKCLGFKTHAGTLLPVDRDLPPCWFGRRDNSPCF